MPTPQDILDELRSLGSESTRRVLAKHGAPENHYGVKIGDLKKIQKRIKKDQPLALALYDTGNADAQYLAGLISDPKNISKAELQHWAETASWSMISEYTVPWVASESPFAWDIARLWIESPHESIASSGWNTLSAFVSITPDHLLDAAGLTRLLNRVQKKITKAPNRVRYTMNGFVICIGCSVTSLTDNACQIARSIGPVHVDLSGTACEVPDALSTIDKVKARGSLGKKRKTAFC